MIVYSITYQSLQQPQKVVLFSSFKAGSKESATAEGLAQVIAGHGDLAWKDIVSHAIEVPFSVQEKIVADKYELDLKKPIDKTKNWLLATIVESKDKKLFKCAEKYLEICEILMIKDKLK